MIACIDNDNNYVSADRKENVILGCFRNIIMHYV